MILDEGYQFGLGAFETIAVKAGHPLLLDEHLARLNKTLAFLEIPRSVTAIEVQGFLSQNNLEDHALKIMASEKNLVFTMRENPYTEAQYQKGATLAFSAIRRNPTSPLCSHKTLNYGDSILEKRKALRLGLDDLVFMNFQGMICEGTACNLFFVKAGELFTPDLACGLLPGIIRDYICQNHPVNETIIWPDMLRDYQECFAVNSLMGIMPVSRLEDVEFNSRQTTEEISAQYRKDTEISK